MVESVPLADSTDADSAPKSSKIKFFGKKFSKTKEEQARAKAEEKGRMKAKKLEREKTMRETKRRRKVDMEKMDEAKLKEYLGNQINRLERDNMVSGYYSCILQGPTVKYTNKVLCFRHYGTRWSVWRPRPSV